MDLILLIRPGDVEKYGPTAHIRPTIPALRRIVRRRRAERELKQAITVELLATLERDTVEIAA